MTSPPDKVKLKAIFWKKPFPIEVRLCVCVQLLELFVDMDTKASAGKWVTSSCGICLHCLGDMS